MNSRLILTALLGSSFLLAAPADTVKNGSGDPLLNYNIPLWDEGKVPLATGNGPLDKPFLTVFMPPEGKRNGGAIVVAPGGGNIMLMYGVEGLNIAERYNDWGVAAFVLTYRLSPRYRDDARVRAALTQLSPDQAQVIQMSFFADKPHSQIAQELGLPLGTVKSRLRLAMVKIRTVMGSKS